jgi:MYXO-CTERM domain-containing protein
MRKAPTVQRRRGIRALGAGSLAGLAAIQAATATTQITFEGFTENNTNLSSLPGFGSNVAAGDANYTVSLGPTGVLGTPNVALTWGVGYQTYTAWDGRGNVAQTDFNEASDIDLTFTPSAGYGVLIDSFDLDEWNGGGDTSVSWSIFDAQGTLASGTWLKSDPGGRDQILTGLSIGDIRLGEAVTLRFNLNAGLPSYLALDNLTFSQVPEPSTIAFGLLGLGALALRRRRS